MLKEIYTNLYLGGQDDIEAFATLVEGRSNSEFCILSAAKEPWHRRALGYTGRSAPKTHPEYLYAHRPSRLILNLVDAREENARYIYDEILHTAVDYIEANKDKLVFVHCNEGKSRAPSIVLMYFLKHTQAMEQCDTFEEVEGLFKSWYPEYAPNGIRVKVKEFWDLCQQPIGKEV